MICIGERLVLISGEPSVRKPKIGKKRRSISMVHQIVNIVAVNIQEDIINITE